MSALLSGLIFDTGDAHELLPSTAGSHELLVWCGDLNYRVAMKDAEARACARQPGASNALEESSPLASGSIFFRFVFVAAVAEQRAWDTLRAADELLLSKAAGDAWGGFAEQVYRLGLKWRPLLLRRLLLLPLAAACCRLLLLLAAGAAGAACCCCCCCCCER